jgi:DNA-binding winged helix-turn-helix (wHTH) protein
MAARNLEIGHHLVAFLDVLGQRDKFRDLRVPKNVEEELLMFLVEKRGQLVTREQISSELWSKDVFVDVEQGINTAIRKIRRALADDAGEPQYLQTVVGRGYRFVAPTAEEDASSQAPAEGFVVSPEELGRAIMTAAGLDPENPRGTPKAPAED